jgi:hypothetical protein
MKINVIKYLKRLFIFYTSLTVIIVLANFIILPKIFETILIVIYFFLLIPAGIFEGIFSNVIPNIGKYSRGNEFYVIVLMYLSNIMFSVIIAFVYALIKKYIYKYKNR